MDVIHFALMICMILSINCYHYCRLGMRYLCHTYDKVMHITIILYIQITYSKCSVSLDCIVLI